MPSAESRERENNTVRTERLFLRVGVRAACANSDLVGLEREYRINTPLTLVHHTF